MLDTLMKIGAYRVEHFDFDNQADPSAFGFYIRGEKTATGAYSKDAKAQLYAGLMLILAKQMIGHLRGIYVDVDSLENLQRPAYRQMKIDLQTGLFKRIFVPDVSALMGTPRANEDVRQLFQMVGGFELMICRDGDCTPLELFG
mgnify:CR=1 FL=1